MVREIIKYPHPSLRVHAKTIETINGEIQALADEMVQALVRAEGLGLAAPQLGEPVRLIVIDVEDEFHILINPRILETSQETVVAPEGCLSIPGAEAEIERAKWVRIEALDLEGERVELDGKELMARVLLHEIDHLDGILFIDHLGEAKRTLLLKEYEKQRKEKHRKRERSRGVRSAI
ncbi:MAG: peptide deformylase [Candidatus Bipolaricaulia bacterium]